MSSGLNSLQSYILLNSITTRSLCLLQLIELFVLCYLFTSLTLYLTCLLLSRPQLPLSTKYQHYILFLITYRINHLQQCLSFKSISSLATCAKQNSLGTSISAGCVLLWFCELWGLSIVYIGLPTVLGWNRGQTDH